MLSCYIEAQHRDELECCIHYAWLCWFIGVITGGSGAPINIVCVCARVRACVHVCVFECVRSSP